MSQTSATILKIPTSGVGQGREVLGTSKEGARHGPGPGEP
jgi:hypothetical protein